MAATKQSSKSKSPKSSGKSKTTKCWSGYERVPGTKAGAEGSCRKKGAKKS